MKTVFTKSDDVIHLFAQKTQHEARCSNVFFEGNKIYSYGRHYLLAEFIKENVILINDVGYSSTTSKHISQIRYATRQYKQFFTTKCDLNLVYQQIVNDKNKLVNARKPEMYISSILSLWESLNEFINFTKRTKIKKEERYKEIRSFVRSIEKNGTEIQKKLSEFEKKEAIRKQRSAKKAKKIALKKFFKYEINSFRIDGVNDFIRISKDGAMIETSQAVSVPISEAKKLYQLIKAGKDIKGYQIDHRWTVTSINGTLKIGCHEIDRDNVTEIGEKILAMDFE